MKTQIKKRVNKTLLTFYLLGAVFTGSNKRSLPGVGSNFVTMTRPVSAAIGERIRRNTKGRFCGENGEIFAYLL